MCHTTLCRGLWSDCIESVHMPKFNYFWTLSKMAEKSRDRSYSEPSNSFFERDSRCPLISESRVHVSYAQYHLSLTQDLKENVSFQYQSEDNRIDLLHIRSMVLNLLTLLIHAVKMIQNLPHMYHIFDTLQILPLVVHKHVAVYPVNKRKIWGFFIILHNLRCLIFLNYTNSGLRLFLPTDLPSKKNLPSSSMHL